MRAAAAAAATPPAQVPAGVPASSSSAPAPPAGLGPEPAGDELAAGSQQLRAPGGPAPASAPGGGKAREAGAKANLSALRRLAHALRQAALAERREARDRLSREPRRLGHPTKDVFQDRNAQVHWEGGTEAEQQDALRSKIAEQKQEVERTRKALSARPRQHVADGGRPLTPEEVEEEIWETREFCSTKLEAIKREEQELRERERRLTRERLEHLRLKEAIAVEDKVCFDSFPMLQERYQLLRVTGHLPPNRSTRVFSAYDLASFHGCTIRLHQFPGQSAEHEARRRLVERECEFLKTLRHPGLLQLLDFFQHDGSAGADFHFATVWEPCGGESLEAYLVRNGPLPEKEARGVVLQLLSALRFSESRGLRLERTDLKLDRVMLCGGEIKLVVTTLPCLRDQAPAGRLSTSPSEAYRRMSSDLSAGESQDPVEGVGDDPLCELTVQVGAVLYALLFGKPRSSAAGHEPGYPAGVQLPDQPRVSPECRECLGRLLHRDRRRKLQNIYSDPFIAPAKKRAG